MSTGYICPDCEFTVVLVNSGGVWRDIICRDCGVEMEYDEDVSTEYNGETGDYELSET